MKRFFRLVRYDAPYWFQSVTGVVLLAVVVLGVMSLARLAGRGAKGAVDAVRSNDPQRR